MKKIKLYFHLPSIGEFLHSENGLIVSSVQVIKGYIDKISDENDSVHLFDIERSITIDICKGLTVDGYQLEIISANGVFYYRDDIRRDKMEFMIEHTIDCLEEILNAPDKFNFDAESI
ncbi:hypothetical protein [Aliikangiella coralliicola]|uniref:Uncharacterized protein n=1 Tax=Aliikangiella coralliicola TaxID=2592383 RepID=A0A545UC93_9GAMM|nr:hypothetical protein [Aliikangiella coralliicola]TQV87088.1 hypothetical protein FLL46_14885 [Aliikangiella coralliicola]